MQKGAWSASYKLPPGTEKWCTHGSVSCIPAGNVVGAPNASVGALRCPSAIEVNCPCSPAGCNDFGPCVASLHKNVSLRERATHKDACCYDLPRQCVPPYVGRPLYDGDRLLTAEAAARADWSAALDGVSADARLWTEIGRLEHSSVASFARVALELLALGAPAELVADVQRAGLDEIEHARLAFAVARAAGAGDVGPGPLPVPALSPPSFVSFAVATLREGCVEETTGAVVARELAAREAQPALRGVLERIAEDEERHAELAWRTLAWALAAGGAEVRAALRDELARLAPGAGTRREVIEHLVRPCLSALLDNQRAPRDSCPQAEPRNQRAPRDSNPRPSDPKSEALSS